MSDSPVQDAEEARLAASEERRANWKRWGTYLAERQWGTAREDYSADGRFWESFTHDDATSRTYRWGEDGILGFCDRQCRLCFAVALWNGRDPILKERLFGLAGPQGNHGEDVKELYYYVDATPTYSYCKGLYKYPQAAFPYRDLIETNARRTKAEREYEITDTGVFKDNRYFDVQVEYAKASPDDICIRISVTNRGPDPAALQVLPQLWFRNTWAWGNDDEDSTDEPRLERIAAQAIGAHHETLGEYVFWVGKSSAGETPDLLFTDNETNHERLFGVDDHRRWSRDAFHEHIVAGKQKVTNPGKVGTKSAAVYRLILASNETQTIRLRLCRVEDAQEGADHGLGEDFDRVFAARIAEADAFYQRKIPANVDVESRRVARQAYAGLIWSKQFYHYAVDRWLSGDAKTPEPPVQRKRGRNADWRHLFNRDIISMPDKWEYPWYAAWDLAFHMIPFGTIDPDFAKSQLSLFLREWYMHPNGQLPAYELNLGDVNPPVHAWACWRVYQITAARGQPDRRFLQASFHKLLLNFTWWVNRKDPNGRHLFSGGFLGLDNIGVFDRNLPLPDGNSLQQADGTAWMAFFCLNMLSIAIELAQTERVYADMASKFLEHFVQIAGAMNTLGEHGLWDDNDGFFYDQLWNEKQECGEPLRVRSLVGLIPLIAIEVFDTHRIGHLRGFVKRALWFIDNRRDLGEHLSRMNRGLRDAKTQHKYILAVVTRSQLRRILSYLLDEKEFLSPYGIRSLSRHYEKEPYRTRVGDLEHEVSYAPGESTTAMFGGNSNWRGPVWLPMNYLLIEALRKWHQFYGDSLRVECPTNSGVLMDLAQVAEEISRRVVKLFLPDENGRRPYTGGTSQESAAAPQDSPLLFHEYFNGDTGEGLGAAHQTGWTALVATCIEELADTRAAALNLKMAVDPEPEIATQTAQIDRLEALDEDGEPFRRRRPYLVVAKPDAENESDRQSRNDDDTPGL
jgi:hypothetical protein